MRNSLVVCALSALLFGSVRAESYGLKTNNVYASGTKILNDLSCWTNSVGAWGSGKPTAADVMVIPADRTIRVDAQTTLAKSVTLYGALTHDALSPITWSNDGFFIEPGAIYNLNSNPNAASFAKIVTVDVNNGNVTVNGTPSNPSCIQFQQAQYSNRFFRVKNLTCAAGHKLCVRNDVYNSITRNNTLWLVDAALFKGSVEGTYTSKTKISECAPRDNGEYGGRMGFTGLDTPGSLIVGANWTLGAEADGVVRAADVSFGNGARMEVALSDSGCSRVEATSSLTVGTGVQIFLIGNPLGAGRYPILTAPTAIDAAAFTLKRSPDCTQRFATLEADSSSGTNTLYLKIGGLYVDAERGNDDWDGSTAVIPSEETIALVGTVPGPKKTLAAIMAIAQAGDTILAAEGTYDEGVMDSGNLASNRVTVARYVTLAASGARDKTIIKGKISTQTGNTGGCGSDSVRCVALKLGSVVKGFTLADGRTCNGSEDNNAGFSGGAVWGMEAGGLVCDCVVTNCGSAKRGATTYGSVTLLRCRVEAPAYQYEPLDFYKGARVIDSLILHAGGSAYNDCEFVNCTFPLWITVYGNGTAIPGTCRNCLHLYEDAAKAFQSRYSYVYNSYYCSSKSTDLEGVDKTGVSYDAASRFKMKAVELACYAPSYRPVLASAAIGKGNLAMYLAATNGWAYTLRRQFTMKDMYGTDRLNGGALDIGAIQHTEVVRYVDADNGDNDSNGLTPATAKRTLKAAVESLTNEAVAVGCVIHAAPGTYDEDEMFYASCSNRVVVPEGVGLVADKGPSVTTIQGKFGDLANASKAGPAAVRCVYLQNRAWIKGFKITGGSTQKSASGNYGLFGGGVYGAHGCIVACEITGNAGGGQNDTEFRGPGGLCGTYIGCYVHDNYGNYQVYNNEAAGDQIVSCVLLGTTPHYGTANFLNSTCDALVSAMAWGSNDTCAANCYFAKAGRGRVYSNCFFRVTSFNYVYNTTDSRYKDAAGNYLPCNNYDAATCRFGIEPSFGANHLPLADSVFVDAASQKLYESRFPTAWAYFKDVGFLGQQRVYNGVIDMGGAEYDVRGDFAKTLNDKHRVTVNDVSSDATATADGVTLNPGDAIEMTFDFRANGEASFTVTGDVTVLVNGVSLAPVGGVVTFSGSIGSKAVVKVTNTGTTAATVGNCTLPASGTRIFLR